MSLDFVIFSCVTLKLFSFSFVPLLARNPGDASESIVHSSAQHVSAVVSKRRQLLTDCHGLIVQSISIVEGDMPELSGLSYASRHIPGNFYKSTCTRNLHPISAFCVGLSGY